MSWWSRQKKAGSEVVIRFGAYSDVGRTRNENEDAYGYYPEADDAASDWLFIVADGMGGHIRGREASTAAVEAVRQVYAATAGRPVRERLAEAFREANAQVYRMAHEDGNEDTMGTTGTAWATDGQHVHIAHVGDSRAYRITEDGHELLTHDHTMVDAMRREGLLTEQEAQHHPRRGALTRAIGTRPRVEVDLIDVGALRAGDRFLLCTDGLADIPAAELEAAVRAQPPQAACEQLVQQANALGGYDNATALVVQVGRRP